MRAVPTGGPRLDRTGDGKGAAGRTGLVAALFDAASAAALALVATRALAAEMCASLFALLVEATREAFT